VGHAQPGINRTAGPGLSGADEAASGYANLLKPIDTPLVFSGFSAETLRLFGKDFASAGIIPVMGAGSVSNDKQPEPLQPGSAVSAILVRGDMNIAGTCTSPIWTTRTSWPADIPSCNRATSICR